MAIAGRLCIIKGHVPLISETFIDAHIERLAGEKVVLYNYFPDYIHNGKTIRSFYSCSPLRRRLRRLLPMFLYDRLVTPRQNHAVETRDFLHAFFRKHRIDCILAEYGMNGADICQTARELNIPLVVHFHGHDAHREPDVEPYQQKYLDMFDYASRIVSVSHLMTEKLKELGAPAEKIVYNPYGAREYFFDVKPTYTKSLLAVGRFADIKAPYLTLLAFRVAASRIAGSRLVMVGDGPLLETCRSLVKTWGLNDRVEFKGALPHSVSLPLFAQACGFVQHSVTTSYGDAEGMPNSILEAGAAGLPVVSTRHAGIVTAVIDGQTGLLVEERDVEGMADKMCILLQNQDYCRAMGAKAKEHIRQNYHVNRHITCLQELLDHARNK
jgi:colanic acid/amylovoran biosynthesis glycosyltransferase